MFLNRVFSIPPLTCQQFYTTLDAVWLHEHKKKEGRRRDQNDFQGTYQCLPSPVFIFKVRTRMPSPAALDLFLEIQGHLVLPEIHNQTMNTVDRIGKTRTFHNCERKFHFIRNCPEPLALTRNVVTCYRLVQPKESPKSSASKDNMLWLCMRSILLLFTDNPATHDPSDVNIDDIVPHEDGDFADQAVMLRTEGDEVESTSAERARSGARVREFGSPPVKEAVRRRARCAVGN